MGYRSTFVSEHIYVPLPEWFIEKWKDAIHFQIRPEGLWGGGAGEITFPISSKFERKFYSGAEDPLFLDLARVLRESDEKYLKDIDLVLMHEDGEIDKVNISADKITIKGSLKYDPEDCYNPQLGDRDEEYIVPAPSPQKDKDADNKSRTV